MKDPHLSGIAKSLAAQGRNGDDTLIHVSRKELDTLKQLGNGLGVHLTKNPQTGLPEAFNWMGTLGGIAGGIIGTIIAPGAGTAAGAALGSAAGTAAGGGSTKQALMAGVLGGVTGYFGGAGLGSLADAGGAAIGEEAGKVALEQTAESTAENVAGGSMQGIGNEAFKNIPADVYSNVTEGMANTGTTAGQQLDTLRNVDAGFANSNAANNASLMDKLQAGWKASPDMFAGQGANILKTGAGLAAVGALNPTESTINTSTTSDSGYQGQMYKDPATGQWRSRAVKMARGGEAYGDYDGADEAADGGYAPGGGLNFAEGGNAAANAPSKGTAAAAKEGKTGLETIMLPADVAQALNNGEIDWENAAALGSDRKQNYAMGGGIGNLGSYSDGGRMLRGPGDGVSDSIPASIDGKRPARLADGEFVVPARAVSELGNGSTEAGSKQLYKMLDRIAAKRKSGKGLAYQASPEKMLPA